MRALGLLAVLLGLTGCAVGNQHTYTSILSTPDLRLQGSRAIAVATEDARPYVLSKDKSPTFVGLSRGGFGNPFDVTTVSGNPLAEDFSATIARALEQRGFKATVVRPSSPLSGADVPAVVTGARAERLAVVHISEWKSDTYMNTALHYDVTLRIFDAQGAQLAANRLVGRDNLGGDAFNPPAQAKVTVPAAYKRKLEELFGTEAVLNSLR